MEKGGKIMKNLLCKFAHWILDKYEFVDLWKDIKTQSGVYKVSSIKHSEFTSDGKIPKIVITYELM